MRHLITPILAAAAAASLTLAPEASGQPVEFKLTASDPAPFDYFGWSVAISGDVAVVGAVLDDDAGDASGTAYVYRYDGAAWSEETKLTAHDAGWDDKFGWSVAISGDVVVVGAWSEDDPGSDSGAAYIYRYDGAAWNEEAKLTASDASAFDYFGQSVSVCGDVAVVGAYLNDEAGSDSGAAYVYRYDGVAWNEETKLIASDAAANDLFGVSIAVSGDVTVVGAHLDDDAGSSSGAAYVYRYDGVAWNEETKLTASDAAAEDRFGWSVNVSGEVAMVGAYLSDEAGIGLSSGAAYVYRFDGAAWNEQAKLTASDAAAGDQFGQSVAVSGDVAVVGAEGEDDPGSNSGAAYVYRYDGVAWNEQTKLTATDAAAGDEFGVSIAISGDVAVVGAVLNDDAGSAYVCQWLAGCPADLDDNGFVGSGDLVLLLGAWGTDPGGPPDFNGDGVVNAIDLIALLGAWGPCPK